MEAIAFLPEVSFDQAVDRKISFSDGLFLLPDSHDYAQGLRNYLNSQGFRLEAGGIFLYFKGDLKQDGTLYEIFQSYAYALTFFYEGRATCRVTQEIQGKKFIKPELFIDEEDKFGVTSSDSRTILRKDLKKISDFYLKIKGQLVSRDYNPLVNSFDFFGMYLVEPRLKIRLLFLNICLESLILGEKESDGVGFKLALRCAYLLFAEDCNLDKQIIFDQVNTAYVLRSKIVHGANYEKAKNKANKNQLVSFESDHIDELEKIVKRIYRIILSKNGYYDSIINGKFADELNQLFLV